MENSSVSVGNNLTAGTTTAVYKVPTGYTARWNYIYIHNVASLVASISVQWYDTSSAVSYDILSVVPVAAKSFLQFESGTNIVLDEGDEVRLTTAVGSTFSAVNTFELIRKR